MTKRRNSIFETARKVFRYDSLRPGQEEAISSVLEGRDTMAIMPTGSGKSAIYQIPAVLLDGPTVVVSPLIALQKDQSEQLEKRDAGGVAVVNSLLSECAQEDAITEVEQGATEFLFMAPEQFANPHRLAAVKAARPSLFVVDEAHCISEWGHSFRPAYLGLKSVIEELGHPTILALTATANEEVRAEIAARLGMRDPNILVHGFDRPNIWFGVEMAASEDKKRAMLLDRIRKTARPGIVYASTRKHAEEINGELNTSGITSAFYHGGLGKKDREAMQGQFMRDEVEVIVATSAFGMGVDKPDVRFVFHYEAPDSIDSYYQQIGRAGRDGEPATAVLFYNPRDLVIHKFFKGGARIAAADVHHVVDALTQGGVDEVKLAKTKLARILHRLEEYGAVRKERQGTVRVTVPLESLARIAEEVVRAQTEQHEGELRRIEAMRMYAENLNCRRANLLRYFGEDVPSNCGNCDNCQGEGTERAQVIAEAVARASACVDPGNAG